MAWWRRSKADGEASSGTAETPAAVKEGAGGPRVVVYTRQGCHLCDVALEIVEIVCAELDEEFLPLDIDRDPVLKERYSDDVPVISVDGVLVARWRISPDALRAALR